MRRLVASIALAFTAFTAAHALALLNGEKPSPSVGINTEI
jgi:hypothetical protein